MKKFVSKFLISEIIYCKTVFTLEATRFQAKLHNLYSISTEIKPTFKLKIRDCVSQTLSFN